VTLKRGVSVVNWLCMKNNILSIVFRNEISFCGVEAKDMQKIEFLE